MPRPRATPLLALFALIAARCGVDDRFLRAGAGGCDASPASAATCAASEGGRHDASGGSGGSSPVGSGGSNADAGADSTAGRTGGVVPQGATGAPCSADPDCRAPDGGPGRCQEDWPGGYCSSACAEFFDCAGNDSTLCRNIEGEDRCLVGCFGPLDCRAGYVCDPELFGCVPE